VSAGSSGALVRNLGVTTEAQVPDKPSDMQLEEMYSKLKIEEQLHLWTRGADRIDLQVMRSVFHPKANINYGYTNGPVEEFLPWVVKFHTEDLVSSCHIIFNLLIRLDGDAAFSEAGVDCRLRYRRGQELLDFFSLARYLDKWERRSGVWGIVDGTGFQHRAVGEGTDQGSARCR
jgi:hypothetical protein